MKTFLFLVLLTQQGLHYEKIHIKNYTSCDDAYKSKAIWYDNPKFKDGNGQLWGFHIYKNKPIVASFCKDQDGNWLL
tara:strand:+ start:3169 stop:3399 length:231 start_codon:yes stop_codon:yes gene_type:complete